MKLLKWICATVVIPFGYGSLSAQPQAVDQEGTAPIIAGLDSLTYLLHSNGFLKNATYTNPKELDFNPNSDLPNLPGRVIQERMNALGSEIPLEYNAHVKGFIDLYGRRKKDLTGKILTLSDYYFPIFEEILDKNELPLELKYLAVVESALNPKAHSWAGASGLWQFIYSTGLRYGLKINSYVDERRDVYKSTQAACDYFKDSYELYGDWLLVIASYNCGPGNVNKAIRRSGGKKNFWQIQQYLPKETRGYVPAFVAVTYVMNYAREHGISPKEIDLHEVVERVEVEDWISFEQLAVALEIHSDEIYDLNPHFKKNVVPGNEEVMSLYLPYEKAMLFASLKDSIYGMPMYDEYGRPYQMEIKVEQVRYKVKKGDNLNTIARKFNVAPADLKEWNVIRKNQVNPGRYLTIYMEKKERVYLDQKDAPVLAEKKEEKKPGDCALFHEVKTGDTLFNIAKRYDGLTVDKLKEMNNLTSSDIIKPGTVLKVKEGG